MRFNYDKAKSERLRKKRGVGFEEVQELFYGLYYLDQILDEPEQWVAIENGLYYHLVTLWKATKAERLKYEEHS